MPASRFGTPRKYPCASTLRSNSFSFTHFRKNASATPLVSHTFKTKDLKPFRFIHFQKKGGGEGGCPSRLPLRTSPAAHSGNGIPAIDLLPQARRGRTLLRSPSPVLPAAALSGCVRIVR